MSKKRQNLGRRNAVQGVGSIVDAVAMCRKPFPNVIEQLMMLGNAEWLGEYKNRPDHWRKRFHQLRQRLGLEAPPNLDHLTADDQEQLTG